MKMTLTLLGLSAFALGLSACQNIPQRYNGNSGYQVESRTENSAIISYTLAIHANQVANQNKLQNTCKEVLGEHQNYNIEILSTDEIANPATLPTANGVQIGKTHTTFGLGTTSNSNDNDYAMRNAMQTRPKTLTVVRFRCSS
ncbi:hypothetical protein [Acinetobacter sp. MB5]|uniref:hypothetical protein n=1 Tax=Acinetobacter sp. MB5 TaxID=2069438 RepID=UPI000DCFF0D3|nr:hypothetical protein [Acinetobacter sp. MB5]